MHRSKKLTQSAQYEPCVRCGADDNTTVWAHSNAGRHGKGMGIKAHDIFGRYLCYRCHTNESQADFSEDWEKSILIAAKKGYL